jgi:two-component system CheB/CheR fusion protein
MLDEIFDLFVQVDRTIERSQGGLGIGLTLVKRLVELHGGTIRAASEGRGRGSEFTITLPIAVEAPQSPEDSLAPAASAGASPRRILVVDDNVDSAQSLAVLLELSGHNVWMVHDGAGAVEAARQFQPDLILLDIGMPGMNGYDACRTIREHEEAKRPVIIALTGWGMEEDRRQSSAAGFDGHLVKPVEPAVLLALAAKGYPDQVAGQVAAAADGRRPR